MIHLQEEKTESSDRTKEKKRYQKKSSLQLEDKDVKRSLEHGGNSSESLLSEDKKKSSLQLENKEAQKKLNHDRKEEYSSKESTETYKNTHDTFVDSQDSSKESKTKTEEGRKTTGEKKLEHLQEKKTSLDHKRTDNRSRLKHEGVKGRTLYGFGGEKEQIRKKRPILPGEKVLHGKSLTFKEESRGEVTEKLYRNYLGSKDRRRLRHRYGRRKLRKTERNMLDDRSLKEDEISSDIRSRGKQTLRGTRRTFEINVKNIRKNTNAYTRLKHMDTKSRLLEEKVKATEHKLFRKEYKTQIRSASSEYQKKKLKKEMVSAIREREGGWIRRTIHSRIVKKKAREETIRQVRRILSTTFSAVTIITILLAILIGLFLVLLMVMDGAGSYASKAITQNDYSTLSDTTAYLKKQETDLEEIFLDEEKKAEFEQDIREENPEIEIYEFDYDGEDDEDYEIPEFGFSSTTLMAYLSVKYISFQLEEVKQELEELFQEMYTIEIEIKEELRIYRDESQPQDPDTGEYPLVEGLKNICYVKVKKKELEEIVEERMTEEEKEQFGNYKLSGGGQQVYSPVMEEDWTNLITSDFGERIHPVTGERTFHNGIDIGIPTGTNLYSAVTGTVTVATYSETAGYYVRIQTETGWVVTFMHMDSIFVSPGDKVARGDYVGESGNTGRSTGPHLHLEVRDASNTPVNPIFIVPQNIYQGGENENN